MGAASSTEKRWSRTQTPQIWSLMLAQLTSGVVRPIILPQGAPGNTPISEGRCGFVREGALSAAVGEQLGMPNARPMPGVAAGVSELRVKGEDGDFRAFYYVASAQGEETTEGASR
jgi:hypothetical protein